MLNPCKQGVLQPVQLLALVGRPMDQGTVFVCALMELTEIDDQWAQETPQYEDHGQDDSLNLSHLASVTFLGMGLGKGLGRDQMGTAAGMPLAPLKAPWKAPLVATYATSAGALAALAALAALEAPAAAAAASVPAEASFVTRKIVSAPLPASPLIHLEAFSAGTPW